MSYDLSKQLDTLQKRYQCGKGRITKSKTGLKLEWRQKLQPSRLSREYSVLVQWAGLGCLPEVEILSPNLRELSGGQRSPHEFFSKGNTKPCLMFNNGSSKDWTPDMLIAESIIPWTQEWLWYWELWLSDGEWRGGGVHPGELTIEQYMVQINNSLHQPAYKGKQ
jgi:hypothetical protein